MKKLNLLVLALLALVASAVPASADWAAGVTTATTSLSTDLTAVGAIILGLVCLIYGFRVVKGMLARG
jgi:hypothetical protein